MSLIAPSPTLHVLALCGSLRAASINAALLRAAARLAPAEVEVAIHPSLGDLPLFNPDLEADLPAPVRALQAAVARTDALLIATPEYAHGVSAAIKNALDWLVSFEPFIHKPVAVINASPRARHADAALREILRTMSAALVGMDGVDGVDGDDASFALPLLGAHLDEAGMVASPAVAAVVGQALSALRAERARQAVADMPVLPIR